MLAELLTITCVIGNPPIIPESIFPVPWAKSSRLVGVVLLCGSSLSVASTHNKVSRLATNAMVNPVIQICNEPIISKEGKVNWPTNESKLSGTGTFTKCSWEIPKVSSPLVSRKKTIPAPTATKGPCTSLKNLPLSLKTVSQSTRMIIAIIAIKVAPGLIPFAMLKISENVFSPSTWKNAQSPWGSSS